MKILTCEQGSDQWHRERLEKISGTRLGGVLGTPIKQDTVINEIIAEFLSTEAKPNYKSEAMLRGSEAEEYAVELYEERTGNIVEQVGMCVHDDYEFLTNSPDGLIGKDGALEIKSPGTDKVVGFIRKNKIPKEYEAQALSYFLVNEKLKWLDFAMYDPRIKDERYQLVIKKITRKDVEDDLNEAMKKVLEFNEKLEIEKDKLGLNF